MIICSHRMLRAIANQRRLADDLLNFLPYAVNAPFNAPGRQFEPTCFPNTRVDVLQRIYRWADGSDRECIFWLCGLAGTGKSTIARTVARHYFERQRLGASFFFSRGDRDISAADRFVTSIAIQLANSIPDLSQHIYSAIMEYSDIVSRSLRDQWQELILRPLSKLNGNDCQYSYVLVVDALDECVDDNDIRIIIRLLADVRLLEGVRLRVFLSSRPEVAIRHGFYQTPIADHQDYVLQNISSSIIDHDIAIFLEHSLTLIKKEQSLNPAWPGDEAIENMVRRSNGLFIWAATACRFIREGKRFAAKRLDTVLKGDWDAVTAPEKHLNEIYTTVLKHSVSREYTDEEKAEAFDMLRHVLGSIVILLSPLSMSSLGRLISVAKDEIDQTLADLHSILDVPQDSIRPLRLHHPSFRDFLLDSNRCTDSNFWVDEKQAHLALAESCMRLMSDSLREDILGVKAPDTPVADMERSRIDQSLLPEVQYACLYWIQHLHRGSAHIQDDKQVHMFLQKHLLHWLEALSWIGKLSDGIHALIALELNISVGVIII
jgi:hypothetical protein